MSGKVKITNQMDTSVKISLMEFDVNDFSHKLVREQLLMTRGAEQEIELGETTLIAIDLAGARNTEIAVDKQPVSLDQVADPRTVLGNNPES